MKGTTKSLGRKSMTDKFYTKPETAKHLLTSISWQEDDVIIEPSAGNGSFSSQIKNCIAMDIAPEHPSIQKQNFLSYYPTEDIKNKRVLVIGNPPFGQNSSLAISFYNHSAEFANIIAFILPKSFRKPSIQNRLHPYFHLLYEEKLPDNSFLLDGQSYSVPTVWQIWERKDVKRPKIQTKLNTKLFLFLVDKAGADIRIQRVGGNAGKASLSLEGALSSNYFIKNTSNLSNQQMADLINQCVFPSITDTIGPKSLSKGELIQKVEEKYSHEMFDFPHNL